MTFAIPARAQAAYEGQSRLTPTHIAIVNAAALGSGVVSGCGVTGSGVDTVAVASGRCIHNTNVIDVAAQSVTISDGHASLPRHDLIVVSEAGVASVVAGTPTAEPATPLPDLPSTSVAIASVWVPATTTSVAANQVTQLGVPVNLAPTYDGDLIQRTALGEMGIYGHSYAVGSGASDSQLSLQGTAGAERGAIARLCSMFGMRARSLAIGGSVLSWNNAGAVGDGGYHTLLQGEQRVVRAGTTLSAQANSGATSITVTSITGFQIGQAIHVGTGSTSGTGGELRYVAATGGSTITLDSALVRTHLNGEPVFEVATAWLAWRSIDVLWWGLHDLGYSPVSSTNPKYRNRYDDALEMVISRCRAAEVYPETHSSQTYTGSWGTVPLAGVFDGQSAAVMNAASAKVTINVPDNYNGTPITLYYVSEDGPPSTTEPILTFTVDGSAAGTKTVYQNFSGKYRPFCKRFTGLSAGRHVIEATLTTYDAGMLVHYDGWSIEATQPPLVLIGGFTKMLDDYSYYNGLGSANQPRTTTLTGTHGVGTTSWTVASTSGWQVGTTATLEPGLGNEESLEVLTIPTGTTFTTAASTKSHAGGVSVRSGIQDYDVNIMNSRQQSIIGTFDENVRWVDVDALLNRNVNYFGYDRDHPNDLGYQVITPAFYNAAMQSPTVKPTLSATTSIPASPREIEYIMSGGTFTNMPAAETEFQNNTQRRLTRTLRLYHQMKFETRVAVVGASGAILYPKYSLDGGTTWKKLDRTATGAEGTGHHLSLAALGYVQSSWLAIPEEARTSNVLLTVFGSGGDGALDPVVWDCRFVFR